MMRADKSHHHIHRYMADASEMTSQYRK